MNNRALTLKALGRLEEALTDVDHALAQQEDFAEAWNTRGIILFDLQRPGEAVAAYDRALALRPDYPEALGNRALAAAGLKLN